MMRASAWQLPSDFALSNQRARQETIRGTRGHETFCAVLSRAAHTFSGAPCGSLQTARFSFNIALYSFFTSRNADY